MSSTYTSALEQYAALGVDTEAALKTLESAIGMLYYLS